MIPLRSASIALLTLTAMLPAQHRVDPRNSYYRVIAVVPFVGSGAPGNPLWPKHVPTGQTAGPTAPKIIAFACEKSDDGQHAIIELVALNRAALADVLSDTSAGVLVFEKGKVSQQAIEAAIQPFKKGFSLSQFGVAVQ